jgi:hypothetical protein
LQGGRFVLRSKQPALVRQELWGVLIAYTLLRRQMRLMAERIKVEPLRMGFHSTSIAIIDVLRHAPLVSAARYPNAWLHYSSRPTCSSCLLDAKITPFPESSNPVRASVLGKNASQRLN